MFFEGSYYFNVFFKRTYRTLAAMPVKASFYYLLPQVFRHLHSSVMNQRELFLKHVAQTSPAPLALEIVKAEGCRMWDAAGKEYIDLIAGISVCNVGHRHPKVLTAIQ